jgi:hypothetical protein
MQDTYTVTVFPVLKDLVHFKVFLTYNFREHMEMNVRPSMKEEEEKEIEVLLNIQ